MELNRGIMEAPWKMDYYTIDMQVNPFPAIASSNTLEEQFM